MKQYIPLILLVILLAAWVVFLDKAADFFVFGPVKHIYTYNKPFQEVTFPTADNGQLTGLYAPAQPGKPTFLVFHGKGETSYTLQNYMLPYLRLGYGMLLFDYRGYGKSVGSPSEKHMYQDGLAAIDYLMQEKLISPQDMVLWGVSLGAAPALNAVVTHQDWPFKALVLQSPFTNTTDVAFFMLARRYQEHTAAASVLSVLLKPFLWDKNFDSSSLISHVKVPLLIGSSQQDKVIPWTMTNALAAKSPAHTHVFTSAIGEHDDPYWFEPQVLRFIKSLPAPRD